MAGYFRLLSALAFELFALPVFVFALFQPPGQVQLRSSFLGSHQYMKTVLSPLAEQASVFYFGDGCFWGRQKIFVDVEMGTLGRVVPSALVGYAGGKKPEEGESVCYHAGNADYSSLGHAEVVGVIVDDHELQLPPLAEAYFKSFQPTENGGMDRPDPQDKGPAYRNVIGIPGGMDNEEMIGMLEEAKQNTMRSTLVLRRGNGQDADTCAACVKSNVVWVLDSLDFPFYRAEQMHQFHDRIGTIGFPEKYLVHVRTKVCSIGSIPPLLGCTDCHTDEQNPCCSMDEPKSGLATDPWMTTLTSGEARAQTPVTQLTCKTLELLKSWQKPVDALLQSELEEKQKKQEAEKMAFAVTQLAATEPIGGKYAHYTQAGIYVGVSILLELWFLQIGSSTPQGWMQEKSPCRHNFRRAIIQFRGQV